MASARERLMAMNKQHLGNLGSTSTEETIFADLNKSQNINNKTENKIFPDEKNNKEKNIEEQKNEEATVVVENKKEVIETIPKKASSTKKKEKKENEEKIQQPLMLSEENAIYLKVLANISDHSMTNSFIKLADKINIDDISFLDPIVQKYQNRSGGRIRKTVFITSDQQKELLENAKKCGMRLQGYINYILEKARSEDKKFKN